MAKESVVNNYFDNLEQCLRKHDLLDKPHLIFNVNEKGLTCDHKPPPVIARADHYPPAVTSGKIQTVTLIGCGSASGYALPPYLIFPGKRLLPDLLEGSSPGATGTMSETGWSNSAIFRDFMENHSLKYIPGRSDEKVLLTLDGHRSHISVGLVDWAKDNNIILFILPAHTSHLLQPLDLACYGSFQHIYNYACHKLMRETAAAITRYNICAIACKVYHQALKPENLQSGFKRAGIYPLNKEAVPRQDLIPAELYTSDTDSDATVEGGICVDVADGYSMFADEDDDESDECCVCNLFTPKEVSGATSLIFTKWAQCDGMINGRPCLHWTHLAFCTEVSVVRRGYKFLYPHYKEEK
ncbi:uncharacterized protein LOC123546012 [Mercenaria mercenaria]|uniref:uncharacterized protein LOC123546012 n=1 Tax=Mercenaria mercenaria TaxID=6596 RepID=UPI00234F92E1|nr:uncharacterized protein LOC123546012 [Mercenaria mercenaria]